MRPEVHLAKRLSKIFCLRLVSWEQRIILRLIIERKFKNSCPPPISRTEVTQWYEQPGVKNLSGGCTFHCFAASRRDHTSL